MEQGMAIYWLDGQALQVVQITSLVGVAATVNSEPDGQVLTA